MDKSTVQSAVSYSPSAARQVQMDLSKEETVALLGLVFSTADKHAHRQRRQCDLVIVQRGDSL